MLGIFCKVSAGPKDKEWLEQYQEFQRQQQGQPEKPQEPENTQPPVEAPVEAEINHQGN